MSVGSEGETKTNVNSFIQLGLDALEDKCWILQLL